MGPRIASDLHAILQTRFSRRGLLLGAGTTGVAAVASRSGHAQAASPPADHTIRIAPVSLEIAPGKIIKTTAYNGTVPGPALRLQEGRPVAINVINDSGYANLVHWHGLLIPPAQDGAVEEGSPIIQPGNSLLYTLTPKPAGTRWYHSHAMAMTDLNRSTYSGEFGFLIVEPAAGDPGQYDREVMLAAHHWEGSWVSMQDIHKGPPPDNGLEAMYQSATLGDRMLGHGEPIRVHQGERVLFRVLNASGSMGISLALSGHRFTVIALDGNPVPKPTPVDALKLDVAERADVIVEMNNPGVWVFGSTDDADRNMGMGVVVEYADRSGEPRWTPPPKAAWDYTAFGRSGVAAAPDDTINLKFDKILGGRGGYNRWTINGKSWPDTNPLFSVQRVKRYRLAMNNSSGDEHPVHLHRHSFEVTKVGDKATSGIIKDTISMPRYSTAEIDFIADDPGDTLFHCHHQDHMDEGFAALINYVYIVAQNERRVASALPCSTATFFILFVQRPFSGNGHDRNRHGEPSARNESDWTYPRIAEPQMDRTSQTFRPAFGLALCAIAALMLTALSGASAAELTASDFALMDRLSFGVTPSFAEHFKAIGTERWIEEQLHPQASAALPAQALAQIEAMPDVHKFPFDIAMAFDQQGQAANKITDPDQRKAAQQTFQQAMTDRARQAAARTILRALYAPDQLRERMTWFWFNHFNVHQYKANIRILVGDYEDRAIRPYAMGHFRDLLSATLHHPAMLRYLDNADNAVGHLNENYAREIMELHTIGVGSGYAQSDVEQLARILTGVGIDLKPADPKLKPELQSQLFRQGTFEFNPARHDYGDKTFLGHLIKGRGLAEVDEALDILCKQPATARHISQKLATYLVGDNPPPALVARMAQTFQTSDGGITAVLSTLLHSPEFAASLKTGTKFKDSVQYVMSAVRMAYDGKVILNTLPIQNWLNRLAEGLFNHETPDGYPLTSATYNGPGQMMVRFEIARQIGSGSAGLFKPDVPNATDQPAFPLIQNALFFGSLQQTLSATTLAALDQAVSPQDWNTLFLSSPEFMY